MNKTTTYVPHNYKIYKTYNLQVLSVFKDKDRPNARAILCGPRHQGKPRKTMSPEPKNFNLEEHIHRSSARTTNYDQTSLRPGTANSKRIQPLFERTRFEKISS